MKKEISEEKMTGEESNNGTNDSTTPKSEIRNPNSLWLVGCFAVSAVAVFLRFWNLTLKPLHHDEGVNGYFLRTLYLDGVYKYDPSNYHGPTLYFIALAFTKLFGLETFTIRASVGVFGVLTVILTFFLRKYIGTIGSLFAALLLALSPGMVYISRYFIHEIFFVFCSLGIVLGVMFFIEGRRAGIFATGWMTLLLLVCFLPSAINLASAVGGDDAKLVWILRVGLFAVEAVLVFFVMRLLLGWNEGRPIYLLLASAAAALLFATKETAFVTIGTLLISCGCVWLWRKIQAGVFGETGEAWSEPVEITLATFCRRMNISELDFILLTSLFTSILTFIFWFSTRFYNSSFILVLWDYIFVLGSIVGVCIPIIVWCFYKPLKLSQEFVILSIAVTIVFVYVFALFFTSFFTYPEGIQKAFQAYSFWTKTGEGEHTQNGTTAYLKWLWKIESPIVFLSVIGTLIALFKAKHRFAIFTGFWAFGLFAAYTIIPYKTPWLALSFLLPMCIVAGYGINELLLSKDVVQKLLAGLFALLAVCVLGYQSYDLNFLRYDDDKMPYVYAHTQRGFLDLIKQIEYYADKSGRGKDVTIEVVSPDYWSMPWYTKDYAHANYPGQITPANTAEMIVAEKGTQDPDILTEYSSHYKYAGTFPLRPGVELYLLVRKDLADKDAKEIFQIPGLKYTPPDDNSTGSVEETK